jgi:hypothetical protein
MGKNRKQQGGQVSAGAPLQYFDPNYQQPSAPAGQNVGNPTSELVVRPALLQQSGGFYPSIMGGVVQNAGLLFPVAARQGMSLFSKYKKGKPTRKGRKTRKARKQTRKQKRRA